MKVRELGMIGAGIASVTVCMIGILTAANTNKKLNKITEAIGSISKDVDLTVPEDIVTTAMANAAKSVTTKKANEAVEKVTKDFHSTINAKVSDAVDDCYEKMGGTLQKLFTDRLRTGSFEKIENKVALNVTNHLIKNLPILGGFSNNSKEQLIKACVDNGFDSHDISRIMQSMK